MKKFNKLYSDLIKNRNSTRKKQEKQQKNMQKLRTQGVTYYPNPGKSDAPSSSTYTVRG